MKACWNVAFRILGCSMKLSFACLGSTILSILKSFNCDAIFTIDLGFTICHHIFVPCLACHLNDSTFKVFLCMGLDWVLPVIASVTVNLSYYLHCI